VNLGYPYQDPALSIDQRVNDLLGRMTLAEKIGQMTQVDRGAIVQNPNHITQYGLGSLLSGGGSSPEDNSAGGWANMVDGFQEHALETRLGIPLIYGIDAVHGHNNVGGAVIFPHNIGLGCTWNPDLVEEAGQITAAEVAGTGIDWTFAPCIAVPRDERWGRTYEGFGETAEINQMMGAASIRGLQGTDLAAPNTILACAKHFIGDGGTEGGDDQGNTQLSYNDLYNIHLAAYVDAIEANVGSVMASYNSWNGQKVHGSDFLLNDLLKGELAFDGLLVSDWAAIDQLPGDYLHDVVTSINAGIDMVMVPHDYMNFISTVSTAVNSQHISEARIDDAVSRILKQKFALGLFENPYTDAMYTAGVGSAEHREVARQCVRESAVLLKNEDQILPITGEWQQILVAGRNAHDLGAQCGGWTISWQGSRGNITIGTTVLDGIMEMAPATTQVTHSTAGYGAENSDLAIVIIGEDPYAEGSGDRDDLAVSAEDRAVIDRIDSSGTPFIVVLISGRPMILGDILDRSSAFIAAWLPGTEGGGLADILFGFYTPTGKLTHSWPRDMGQIPINWGDFDYDPLFPYQYGLENWGIEY